jgi:aldehyde:ferredoxin oxidoreductase
LATSCGRHGAFLRIDLTTGEATPVPIPADVARRFVGGVGLGTWICLREGGAETDPLAPDAPLVFCLSPLVGTPLTTSAKFAVVGRSPLTGFLSDAVSSSHFAIAAKRAGYDAYVLKGRAQGVARLVIDDGAVEVRDATHLAGLAADECELDGFRTAAIGPAGERLVRYATITNDGRHAGRGGLGAVMGAKNLKAFSIRGAHETEIADPRGVVAAARALSEKSLGPATAKYRELGTIANVAVFNRLQALPTRNFLDQSFADAPKISAEVLHERHRAGRASCAACTIGCEHLFRPPGGRPVRLEYETLFALGALLGIGDRRAVLEAAALCARLGIDTISAGGTLRREKATGTSWPRARASRRIASAGRSWRCTSRGSRSRATTRAGCRRWRSVSPSARAAPTTTGRARTRSTSRPTRSISPAWSPSRTAARPWIR